MKKSLILLELIITIVILSIVGVYSLKFISDLYKKNSLNLTLMNNRLDFQSTRLFIENKLHNSVKTELSSHELSFYEVDINYFKSSYYSGFALIDKSTKEYVFTPNSTISKIDLFYIWFDDNHMYEIEQNNESEKIYFKNPSTQKRIFEHYKLIKQKSKFFVQNKTLYFNNIILLENIESFKVSSQEGHIKIRICERFCEEWIVKI